MKPLQLITDIKFLFHKFYEDHKNHSRNLSLNSALNTQKNVSYVITYIQKYFVNKKTKAYRQTK